MKKAVCISLAPALCLCLCLQDPGWSGAAAADAATADWPQFRGPNRNGISPETGVLRSWPAGGPKVLWKAPVGEGFSQVVASRGRLFTLYGRGDDEVAVALDAATGKQLWRVRLDKKILRDQGNGPRSTPTVDGDLVYVLSASGKLAALKTANGQTAWQHDLAAEYKAPPPQWGVATSPLVEGNLLLVNAGGAGNKSVMAFDKTNGKPVWTSQNAIPGYSSPIAITVGGVRQIIVFGGDSVLSLSPKDGKLFWRVPWKNGFNINAATPIFVPPDKLFVSSGYDSGAGLFQIRVAGNQVSAVEVWKSRGMKNQFSSSILHNGILYGFDIGTLKAIDAATSKERWKHRGLGHGSMILAGGRLIILSEQGKLAMAEATPEGYRELGSVQVFSGRCWTAPALADGKLFVRDQKELVAFHWSTGSRTGTGR